MNEHNAEPDPADIIAGALQVSRGYAYDLMRKAVSEQFAAPVKPEAVPAESERWVKAVREAEHFCPTDLPHLDRIRWKANRLRAALSTQEAVPNSGNEHEAGALRDGAGAAASELRSLTLGERDHRLVSFALHRFAAHARERVNAAAQDKDGRYFAGTAVATFTRDAEDAERLLTALRDIGQIRTETALNLSATAAAEALRPDVHEPAQEAASPLTDEQPEDVALLKLRLNSWMTRGRDLMLHDPEIADRIHALTPKTKDEARAWIERLTAQLAGTGAKP